jgi:hypothetical protein
MLCPAQTSTPACQRGNRALGASSGASVTMRRPRGGAQPLDHLRVDGGEARLVMDALFRGVEMRALDMQAQHAGHALFQRRLARASAASTTCGWSLISVGIRPVVPAAMRLRDGAMPSHTVWSLNSTSPPPLTCVSIKPGSSVPPPRSTGIAVQRAIAGRGKAQDPPVRDQQRLMLHDPVGSTICAPVKRSRPGHNVRVTLLRWGGLSGLQPRASESHWPGRKSSGSGRWRRCIG